MIWAFLSWFQTYWPLIIWGVGILVAWRIGGWRLALVVLTLGVGYNAYNAGKKSERENAQKRAEKIQKEREIAYDEIDARGTGRDNVVERLRDGNF